MGLRTKKINIMGGGGGGGRGLIKNPIFRGGVPEKTMYRGELSKKGVGTWTV